MANKETFGDCHSISLLKKSSVKHGCLDKGRISILKKQKRGFFFLGLAVTISVCSCTDAPVPDIPPNPVIPTPIQLEYQKMEFIGFIHFGMNTFMDKEWGFGDESPQMFNPTGFDAGQWARVASDAGMKELILTVKHHDGFCLWPSKYTDHSVKNSPWKNGQGDIVREFVDACRCLGLKVGFYLSPWDRNHPDYGNPAYIEYYRNQLKELLIGYGEISEVWFDGANGGTGYYGGANENRRIDRKTYYQWQNTWALVKKLQPKVLIFSDAGPDIRWIGNERGYAGETNWSLIDADSVTVGEADNSYLNSGDPEGNDWVIPLCNTSIRPGWFYHPSQDEKVKTAQDLMDVFYKSVGRNGVLLLNIPPDKRGLFHENDVRILKEFKEIREETFKNNLASGKKVEASSHRMDHPKFAPHHIVDGDPYSYWAAEDGIKEVFLEIDLGETVQFDRILLQEPIRFGQRISDFEIRGWIENEWVTLSQATTIGYKRILRLSPVLTHKVQLVIRDANNVPAISNFGLYKSSEKEIRE
jgi:alpha-L-fucosidase